MYQIPDRITPSQLSVLVSTTVVGVGFLSMPRHVATAAGRDGWISVLMAGALVGLASYLFAKLAARQHQRTPYQMAEAILGPWAGKALGVLLVATYVLLAAVVLRDFAEVMKEVLMPKTPVEIIVITMMLTVVYLVPMGLNPLGRLAEVFFPIIILAMTAIFGFAQAGANYGELRPILAQGTAGWRGLLAGMGAAHFAFVGFGTILFAGPFVSQREEVVSASLWGMALPIAVNFSAMVMSIANFGPLQTSELMYPVLDLGTGTSLSSDLVPRLDLVVMVLWVLAAFSSIAPYHYFATLGVAHFLNHREVKTAAYLLLPWVAAASLVPANIIQFTKAAILASIMSAGITLVFVLMLVVDAKRGSRAGSGQAQGKQGQDRGAREGGPGQVGS